MIFRPYASIYMDIKKHLSLTGVKMMVEKFSTCRQLVNMAKDIENLSPDISKKNYDIRGFVYMFEDNIQENYIDYDGLKFVEDYLGSDLT